MLILIKSKNWGKGDATETKAGEYYCYVEWQIFVK